MLGTAAGSSLCIPQIHERAHPAKLLMLLTAERRAKPPRHCRAAPALSFQDKPSFLTGERENSWVPGIPVHQQHTQELGNMQLFGTDRGCISILWDHCPSWILTAGGTHSWHKWIESSLCISENPKLDPQGSSNQTPSPAQDTPTTPPCAWEQCPSTPGALGLCPFPGQCQHPLGEEPFLMSNLNLLNPAPALPSGAVSGPQRREIRAAPVREVQTSVSPFVQPKSQVPSATPQTALHHFLWKILYLHRYLHKLSLH